ncbi:hypothetical protein ACWDZ6_07990 [Streptomyces sp. NPDC002926]
MPRTRRAPRAGRISSPGRRESGSFPTPDKAAEITKVTAGARK